MKLFKIVLFETGFVGLIPSLRALLGLAMSFNYDLSAHLGRESEPGGYADGIELLLLDNALLDQPPPRTGPRSAAHPAGLQ